MQIVNANVRGPQEDPNSLAKQNLFGAYVGGLQQQRTDDAKMAEQLIKQWDSAWGDKIHLLVGLPDDDPAKTQAITSLDVALQTWNRATGGTKSPAEIAAIRNGFLSSGAPGALTAPQQMDIVNQWGQTPPKEGVGLEPSSSVPPSTTPTTPVASRVDPRAPVSEITLPTIPTAPKPTTTPAGSGGPSAKGATLVDPGTIQKMSLAELYAILTDPESLDNMKQGGIFGNDSGWWRNAAQQRIAELTTPWQRQFIQQNGLQAFMELQANANSSEVAASVGTTSPAVPIDPAIKAAGAAVGSGEATKSGATGAPTLQPGVWGKPVVPAPPAQSQGIGPLKRMDSTVPGSSAPQAPGVPAQDGISPPPEEFWNMPVPISALKDKSGRSMGFVGDPTQLPSMGLGAISQDFSAQGLVNQIKSFELSRGKRLNQLASEGDPTAIALLGKVVESFAPGANLIEASTGTPFEGLFQNSDFFQPTTPTTPAPATLPASPETVEIDVQQQLAKNPAVSSASESHDGSKPFDRLWADIQEVRKAPPTQATGAKFTAAMKKVGEISARVAQGALRAAEKTGEGAGGIWNALGTRAVGSALEVAREAAKTSLGITPMTDAEKNALLAKYMKMDEAELALRGFKDAASIKYNRRALAAEIEMNSQRLESSMITAAMKNGGDELEKVNKAAKAENEKKINAVDTVFKKLKSAGKKDAMTDEEFVLQSGNKDLLLQFQAKHWLETGELLDITGKKFLGGFSGFAPVTDPVKIKEFLTKAGLENYTPNPQLSASVTGMIQAGAQAASGTTPVTTTKIPTDAPVSQASKESWVDSILKK